MEYSTGVSKLACCLSLCLSVCLSVCLPRRMRSGRCSVQCGGLLLVLLSCCLLSVHSQVDPQQHPPVVASAAQVSGHGHGRLDKNMIQDKE